MKYSCHVYSNVVAMFNEIQFAMFDELLLPCLMHSTSIGHDGMEMQMPIKDVMQSFHVYSTAVAMFK